MVPSMITQYKKSQNKDFTEYRYDTSIEGSIIA